MGASILPRKRKDEIVFRLRIRIKDYPSFSATFCTAEDCKDWLDMYYERYLKDPVKFMRDHRKYTMYMKKNRICVDENGMLQPRLRL